MKRSARAPDVEAHPETPHRAPGRPRGQGIDARILEAAMAIAAEVGFDGLTVSEVIARSGVARATVYRRFPTREALLDAAIGAVKGRPPFPFSGDIEEDIRRGAEGTRAIFAERRFQAMLPSLVGDLLKRRASPNQGVSDAFDRVAPNHRRVAEEYAAIAAQAGLRTDIDPFLPPNIIVGAVLVSLLSTGRAPTKAMADDVVDVLLNGLRRR